MFGGVPEAECYEDPYGCDASLIRVITGVDDEHTVITEPLTEIQPGPGEHGAELAITFTSSPAGGIEGSLAFVRATSSTGEVLFDARVDPDQERVIQLPAGEYSLEAYYRPCDGNCTLLDPAGDICQIDAQLADGSRNQLTVRPESPSCQIAVAGVLVPVDDEASVADDEDGHRR